MLEPVRKIAWNAQMRNIARGDAMFCHVASYWIIPKNILIAPVSNRFFTRYTLNAKNDASFLFNPNCLPYTQEFVVYGEQMAASGQENLYLSGLHLA